MVRLTSIICLVSLFLVNGSAQAGWPFFSEDGLRRGSPEYYEAHAGDPPGVRQKYAYGKLWPMRARPVGPSQTFVHQYHAAHYWPEPYVCDDRAIVEKYASTQVANGWQAGTTLYDYHFDPVSHELNSSGQQHLQWIMTSAPSEFRQTYVSATNDPQYSNLRVANVERTMAGMVGTQVAMPVALRVSGPLGRPADEVNTIFKTANENMPVPTILYKSASSE